MFSRCSRNGPLPHGSKDMHQLLVQPLSFHIPPPSPLSLPLPLFSSLLIAFVIGHRVPYIHPSHTALRTADGGRTTVDRACSGQAQTRAPHNKLSSSCRSRFVSDRTVMSDADSASRLRGIIFQGCVENHFQCHSDHVVCIKRTTLFVHLHKGRRHVMTIRR